MNYGQAKLAAAIGKDLLVCIFSRVDVLLSCPYLFMLHLNDYYSQKLFAVKVFACLSLIVISPIR